MHRFFAHLNEETPQTPDEQAMQVNDREHAVQVLSDASLEGYTISII
jgi:hypothetical protein